MITQAQFQDIDASEFKAMKDNENTVVIDVRTSGEVAGGKIPGAIHADIMGGAFPHIIAELDKSKNYLVYCAGGNRSRTACSIMGQQGFEFLFNLSGGIMNWPYETE